MGACKEKNKRKLQQKLFQESQVGLVEELSNSQQYL
jgi:hypothetical protein